MRKSISTNNSGNQHASNRPADQGRISSRWSALTTATQPFARHEFHQALERHGCVGAGTGWTPAHLERRDSEGSLNGAMPLYSKNHSWGEFVFDFAWAQGYADAGLNYYPKLVAMCPFTPTVGPRLLARQRTERISLLLQAIETAQDGGFSSLHILFTEPGEQAICEQHGLIRREDCRFLWRNRNYSSFDEFLASLRSTKRKKIRQERRRVASQGIVVETVVASSLSERQWHAIYAMLSRTFIERGHTPYLSLEFLRDIAQLLGPQMLCNVASIGERPVGVALCFRDDRRLYGRYWGAAADFDCLHFETCYYRGIEYCIEQGLSAFDPGTHGEHKVQRGFTPTTTTSAHWIVDPGFRPAVEAYAREERRQVRHYMKMVDLHSPYRRGNSLTDE